VTVLEKEAAVGQHQSGRNSGVLHAGLYYRPGSAKARLAVQGIKQMTAFCQEHGIAHEVCGKLVVAADEAERPRLQALYERGTQNGLSGLRLLGPEAMRDIEPHAGGVAAIHVPEEGIVDYPAVCATLARLLEARGAAVVTGAAVRRMTRGRDGSWTVRTSTGDHEARFLVTCGGLHADRLCRAAGAPAPARIVPFRGEYYTLRPGRDALVRHLIYPVPDPGFPFLGVHFTRMIRGGVEAGPNAVLALSREGYAKLRVRPADLAGALAYPGLWRFLRRHPGMTWRELRRSFSRRLFAASLQRLVPAVTADDLAPGGAGVRAQAMLQDGTFVEDFLFVDAERALHVVNAPSPGATASLAIGDVVARRVLARLPS
jgi:L-2-hydroxyglutarate oxidase